MTLYMIQTERNGEGFGSGVEVWRRLSHVTKVKRWVLVFSFPNSVWERRPRNSVSRLPRGHRTRDAKQSFAKIGSQTEFGNQERETRFTLGTCYSRDPQGSASNALPCGSRLLNEFTVEAGA